jgi:hypothetical protein
MRSRIVYQMLCLSKLSVVSLQPDLDGACESRNLVPRFGHRADAPTAPHVPNFVTGAVWGRLARVWVVEYSAG